ncbi:MAG: prepilin-type N-terminal cleavage/methylation domain-containing protein [Candidatus Pacebacteria bacterium]|nr:prepilin-type N-terminal cleavage/methylation domain-containing protein [Candidatus Paceibacterota bacterium]
MQHCKCAFTLIECLIYITVFSLLMTTLILTSYDLIFASQALDRRAFEYVETIFKNPPELSWEMWKKIK